MAASANGSQGARRSRRSLFFSATGVIALHAALLLTGWSAVADMGPGVRPRGLLVRLLPPADLQPNDARENLPQAHLQSSPTASSDKASSDKQAAVREASPPRTTAGSPAATRERSQSAPPVWHAGQVLVRLPLSELPDGACTFTLNLLLDEHGRVVQVIGTRPALPPALLDAATALLGETRFDPEEGSHPSGEFLARLNIRFEPAEWLTY